MYKLIFGTRLSRKLPSLQELVTTKQGFRLATSVGGVLTGRGAEFLIIDDSLRPEEALSEVERNRVNAWYDHTLLSRLNDKREGRILIIMQRLHEDDLVGHLLEKGGFELLRLPAIADTTEIFPVPTPFGGEVTYTRQDGELLHPAREDRATLDQIAATMGEYHFSAQYQQAPIPLGGGIVKMAWFQTYTELTKPASFDFIFQSWDTANKSTELSNFSVCTTWGKKGNNLYLLHVYRERLDFPSLKRAVVERARLWNATTVLIEDRASGTQLIQELRHEGVYVIKSYEPPAGQDKVMRMHGACSLIENGFVFLPEKAEWLAEYLREMKVFPNGKYDDQVDSTAQALDWIKQSYLNRNVVRFFKFYPPYDLQEVDS